MLLVLPVLLRLLSWLRLLRLLPLELLPLARALLPLWPRLPPPTLLHFCCRDVNCLARCEVFDVNRRCGAQVGFVRKRAH